MFIAELQKFFVKVNFETMIDIEWQRFDGGSLLFNTRNADVLKTFLAILKESGASNDRIARAVNGYHFDTPLHRAASNNRADVIPVLIAAGGKMNRGRIPDGKTPLDLADEHHHKEAIAALEAAGAIRNTWLCFAQYAAHGLAKLLAGQRC